jgi:hypothetical protein
MIHSEIGYNINVDGIRFLLDENGITDISERQVTTHKIVSYLIAANNARIAYEETKNKQRGK